MKNTKGTFSISLRNGANVNGNGNKSDLSHIC